MKFLIDVSLGCAVDDFMKNSVYDVICVRDINSNMEDIEILKLADRDNRIVVTMDKDFGELVYKHSIKHQGVLLLRLEDESAVEKITAITNILNKYPEQIQNSFCTYKNNLLRVKK